MGTRMGTDPNEQGGLGKVYSIAELAQELGVTTRTIRFYEDQGLISPQRAGHARIYTTRDRARLLLILRGKRLGFSLKDIKEFLDLHAVDAKQVGQLQLLAVKVKNRITALEAQREEVETVLAELQDIKRAALKALRERGTKEGSS